MFYFSLFLSIIQLVAVIACLVGIAGSGKTVVHCQLSGKDQFSVAPNNNIIVIVLDRLGNGYLNEEFEKNPDLLEGMEDFTYYTNYDSRFNPTFPSMCHLLTGAEPDTELSRFKWAKQAWETERCNYFYRELHDLGYVCNTYSTRQVYVYGMIDYLLGKIDNIEDIESTTNYKLMYPMMLKYSIYRYVPYVLKPRFEVIESNFRGVVYYELQEETVDLDSEFYKKLVDKRLLINNSWDNAFIINHIQGVHGPYEVDRTAHYTEKATKLDALYASFTIVNEYIHQLKMMNLYDSSTIIVMSDHGAATDEEGILPNDNQAILFIKAPYDQHEQLQSNSAPVCSDDFQATILDLLNVDYAPCGTSIYDWKEGQERERVTYFMDKSASGGLFGYVYHYDADDLRETMQDGYDVMYYNAEW